MSPRKIILFHSGSIGDTIIALPFLAAIRKKWKNARITLFTYSGYSGVKCVREILVPTGVVDDIIGFSTSGNRWEIALKFIVSFWDLRKRRFDLAININRTAYSHYKQRIGVWWFLCRLIGIRHLVGGNGLYILPPKKKGVPLPTVPHHMELIARRLAADGLQIPLDKIDPSLLPSELQKAECVWQALALPEKSFPVAVGIGGKKLRWPPERFAEAIKQLQREYEIVPIFFGGPENIAEINELTDLCGGVNAARLDLNLRESIALLRKCFFYLGNDTGTLHMAVSAGLKCVGIYSAHNYPGIWYPWGEGHIVLRRSLPCDGCQGHPCARQTCLADISVDEVVAAVEKIIRSRGIDRSEQAEDPDGAHDC